MRSLLRHHSANTNDVYSLVVNVLAGALGLAYFVYGRRQARYVPMLAGVALCAYPYFIDSLAWSVAVGGLLAAAPFLFRY